MTKAGSGEVMVMIMILIILSGLVSMMIMIKIAKKNHTNVDVADGKDNIGER